MTTGIKWKRTGKWEPGRIGCGRGTIVKIRLWLVVRGFTLVQPFCFHCYDRYESRQCNIVVDSVLNNNVEKFQRQKSIFGLSTYGALSTCPAELASQTIPSWCKFHFLQNCPARSVNSWVKCLTLMDFEAKTLLKKSLFYFQNDSWIQPASSDFSKTLLSPVQTDATVLANNVASGCTGR